MLQGKSPCASGAFGSVYQCTIKSGEGTVEVAVKIFSMAPHAGRAKDKIDRGIRRELKVWVGLRDSTIVPLLGFANVNESSFPALVSEWMSSGTLYEYLEERGTISASAKVTLAKGVADGLAYLHSNKVVHGDLHPGNVLIDSSGHPRLTDFGLATVAGDKELQWNSTTAGRNFNPRWRAPEVMGVGQSGSTVTRPNFKSDVYSFGSVMFFIVSGVIPWNGKTSQYIIIQLSKQATPARRDNILVGHWGFINRCWSWNPVDRPEAMGVASYLAIESTTIAGETEMAGSRIKRPMKFASLWFRNLLSIGRSKPGLA
ncbi:kinase-like domain-containing protein [Suillus placidus]|uniref:Kinase-like domain-containing protein n=1 Tax=Suillus placidus TaxID=48579 RepID=A0A9P6ZVP1_9AGAM|nr:kinase-like domain-containing protein [Suillus placidus]